MNLYIRVREGSSQLARNAFGSISRRNAQNPVCFPGAYFLTSYTESFSSLFSVWFSNAAISAYAWEVEVLITNKILVIRHSQWKEFAIRIGEEVPPYFSL